MFANAGQTTTKPDRTTYEVMPISPYLQHTYFSQRNLLNDRIILRFHKLLDGDDLAGVSVSALEHHTVGALTYFGQLFIFLHGAICSCPLSQYTSLYMRLFKSLILKKNPKKTQNNLKQIVKLLNYLQYKAIYILPLYMK